MKKSGKRIADKAKNIFASARKTLMQYTWWELTIFIIGSASFVSILVVLFLPIGTGPGKFTVTGTVPPAANQQFPRALADTLTLPLKQGNEIKILNNGDAFVSSFLPDIDNAHSSINIMLYIWEGGTMSNEVLDHLDAKLKEGVPVRIMLDAFGGGKMENTKEFKIFKDLGGKVEVYHSLTVAPWEVSHNQKRNHRRAIIIDGKVGYTGGMAVKDTWLGNASSEEEWRDMMFRVTGPMAVDLQSSFAELWTSNSGEILAGETFYPPTTATSPSVTYVPLSNTPSTNTLVIQKFILLTLLGAQHKIYITTPYFLPDKSFRDALISKSQAGVDVRVLVPDSHNDSKAVRYASHKYYQELLEGGVRIYEYSPTFIHAKSIVVDDAWSVIGSANMDNRSRAWNEENIYGVADKTLGGELETIFLSDIAKAKEINLAEWKKRGVWQHILEFLSPKFAKQY